MDATLQARAEELATDIAGEATTIEELKGLLQLMMKSGLERMLDAEMDVHLGRRPSALVEQPSTSDFEAALEATEDKKKNGANYGWPKVDHGPTNRDGVAGPIYAYPQASISGGDFSDSADSWPEKFGGKYFFGDFVHGWIKAIDPTSPATAVEFAQGLRRIVDLRFASDGSLYVLLRNAWVVDDKFEGGTGALMRIRYDSSGDDESAE